ncbi:MAG: 6-aminohexanoate hydrolase [Parvularcula sp.]|nr:6-aminohexanoate hydrolase [Parvularcula sp.]
MSKSERRTARLMSVVALSVAALAPSMAAGEPAGPSEAIKELRRIFFSDPKINVLTFHNIDEIFHTIPVEAAKRPWRLTYDEKKPDFTYAYDGEDYAAEDVLERTYTNALLIIKDDKIVYERYRNLTDEDTHFLSMSMAKSITSVLVGIAVEQGLISSVDDQIVKYVPELKGSAYDGVTVRQALLMKTGVNRADNYDPSPDSAMSRLREKTMVLNEARATEEALLVERIHEPGTQFSYSTLNTTVLGWVLEKAAGEPLPTYMERVLWKPMGAESYGFWMADGPEGVGRATNGMGYNAVLRDYARFGLMMLHEGKANKRQIVSRDWVEESTIPEGPEPASEDSDQGYQYQWWTLTDSNAYMAVGLQGQFIYIDPDTDTVVVKLSYFPLGAREPYRESEAFFRAASAWRP